MQGDDSGSLAVVDLAGQQEDCFPAQWFTIQGLAWSPDGKEIWFTASKSGTDRTLYATSLDGKERMVAPPARRADVARYRQRWTRAAGSRQLAP